MEQLARLEDLPQTYIDHLTQSNLVPLWPSLRNVLPPKQPVPLTQATVWHYRDIKPLLLEAGELTPIEKAERRVLVLANPGHGLENMKATSSISSQSWFFKRKYIAADKQFILYCSGLLYMPLQFEFLSALKCAAAARWDEFKA